jgi:uncharacterized protein (TIGR04255 family)
MVNRPVSFAHPPVVEVVAGLVFTDYSTEFSSILSAFWKEILRDQFPVLQQQPPYTAPEEQFQDQPSINFNFQFGGGFPAPRLWASTQDGGELIQLQPDWFAHNWRKVKPDGEYDRWPTRRAALADTYEKLSAYLTDNNFTPPVIRQCEVTYINHMTLDGLPGGHGSVGTFIRGQEALSGTRELEQLLLQTSYRLGNSQFPTGRLHVKLNPALDASGKPIYVFELTARSVASQYSLESALAFLDSGRDAINTAFVETTTDDAHQRWGMEK